MRSIAGFLPGYKDGVLSQAQFRCPAGVRVDPQSPDPNRPILLVSDYFNHSLREINILENSVRTLIGSDEEDDISSTDPSKPVPFTLVNPTGVLFRDDGDIFVSDYLADRIVHIKRDTLEPRIVAGVTKTVGARDSIGPVALFRLPTSICWIPQTSNILVCDYGNHALRIIENIGGEYSSVSTLVNPSATRGIHDGDETTAQFTFPRTAVFRPARTSHVSEGFQILVSDKYSIRQVTISPSEAQNYLLRRPDTFSLSAVSPNDEFADATVTIADGSTHKLHAAVVRARCPKLFTSLRESGSSVDISKDHFALLTKYVRIRFVVNFDSQFLIKLGRFIRTLTELGRTAISILIGGLRSWTPIST